MNVKKLWLSLILIITFFSNLAFADQDKNKVTNKKVTKKAKHLSKVNSKKNHLETVSYRFKRGDNLYKIAKRYGIKVEEITALNNNLDPKNIKIGTVIKIPKRVIAKKEIKNETPNEDLAIYRVKKGDTLYSISKRFSISQEDLKRLNKLKDEQLTVGYPLILKGKHESLGKLVNEKKPVYTLTNDDYDDVYGEEDQKDSQNTITAYNEKETTNKDQIKSYEDFTLFTMADEQIKRLINYALDFLGTTYKYGGDNVNAMDCSAFVKRVFNEVNINLPRTSREQFTLGIDVPLEELREGDLLFFAKRKRINHVAIYIGDDMFIHAARKGKGVIVSSLDSPYFKKHFVGAKRLFIRETEKANIKNKNLSLAEKPLIN